MNNNPDKKNPDDDDDQFTVNNSGEKPFDFSKIERKPNINSENLQEDNEESVADHSGASEVGKRKKFTVGRGSTKFILAMTMLGICALGSGFYYVSNISFSPPKSDIQTIAENEDLNQGSKNFKNEFEQNQTNKAEEQEINNLVLDASSPVVPDENIQQIPLDNNFQNVQQIPLENNQPVMPTEKPLSAKEIREQRALKSDFGGSMGGASSIARSDNGSDKPNQSALSQKVNASGAFSGVKAGLMGNRDLMIDQGTFIECVLQTRFNSQLAGMLSCEVPRNIYSASGKTVLIDRGSKVIGQYQGDVENNQVRVFILWNRIVTPKGVSINIDSPASSPLGESGVTGRVNTHFWKNLGTAYMVSLTSTVGDKTGDAIGRAISKKLDKALGNSSDNNNGDVIFSSGNNSANPSDVAIKSLEKLSSTKPTITKNQGDRIMIFVARDVDFSNVYQLRKTQ